MQNSKAKLVVSVLLVLQLGVIGSAQETKIKAGKRGDITLSSITKVGNLTLQPGQYILQHRTSHGKHAMHFVSFIPYGGEPGHGRTYSPVLREFPTRASRSASLNH